MTDEFDERVMEYANWLNSPYSHSLSPADSEGMNGVKGIIRSLGGEPSNELSLDAGTVIRNPLQLYNLTEKQKEAITIGADFVRPRNIFECVADKNLTTVLDELGEKNANNGFDAAEKVIDILRKRYYEDC